MLRHRFTIAALASTVVAALASISAQTGAGDWPQYLGPSRNGLASSPIPHTARLAVSWRTPLPMGDAGLVVASDRLYTMGAQDERDYLIAVDAGSGRELWRTPLGPSHADAASGPESTPAIAGDLIVALGSSCRLIAARAANGEVAWEHDLVAEYKSRFAKRGGCGMSPLVSSGRVILPTGAPGGPRVVAFAAASGMSVWTAADVPSSLNASLGLSVTNGTPRVLYHHVKPPGTSGVTALNPETGAVLWQLDGKGGNSTATPLSNGSHVLLQTWADSTLFDTGGAPARAVWSNTELSAIGPPPVLHGGYFYGFGGNSGEFLKAVDAATGVARWSNRIYRGYAALAGDTLVVLSESSGLLRLVAADPSSYRELARLQVLPPGARTSTPPTVAGGRVFVRNLEEVVAVDTR
jgi:outer membrane protein assembly factor BamB